MSDENCFLNDEPPMQMSMSAADEPIQKKKVVIKKGAEPAQPEAKEFNVQRIAEKLAKMTKDDALGMLDAHEEDTEYKLFLRGGVLSVIRKNNFYEPCTSFEKWVEANTTMARSTAHALATTYERIVEAGLTAEQVQEVGWTKLRIIASKLSEDAAHWLEMAHSHGKKQLGNLVRGQANGSKAAAKKKSKNAVTKIFKLSSAADEVVQKAIERAKEQTGVDADHEALEHICSKFVAEEDIKQKLLELEEDDLILAIAGVLDNLTSAAAGHVVRKVFDRVSHEIEI